MIKNDFGRTNVPTHSAANVGTRSEVMLNLDALVLTIMNDVFDRSLKEAYLRRRNKEAFTNRIFSSKNTKSEEGFQKLPNPKTMREDPRTSFVTWSGDNADQKDKAERRLTYRRREQRGVSPICASPPTMRSCPPTVLIRSTCHLVTKFSGHARISFTDLKMQATY